MSSIHELITSTERLWKWSMLLESKAACQLSSHNQNLDNKTCLTVRWSRLLEDSDPKIKHNKLKELVLKCSAETNSATSLFYLEVLAAKDIVQITVKIRRRQFRIKKIININILVLYYDLVFIAFISQSVFIWDASCWSEKKSVHGNYWQELNRVSIRPVWMGRKIIVSRID